MAEASVGAYHEALASRAATPGGGAVAAFAGASGAALIAMVGRLTVDRAGFEDLRERMEALIAHADRAREEFLDLAERDKAAFDGVMTAFGLAKETDTQRADRVDAIQRATEEAAEVPLAVARRARDLMELAEDATAMGNPNAASDGAVAAASLWAAVEGASYNVLINAASLTDEARAEALRSEVAAIRERAGELYASCEEAFGLRLRG
jgi:formiminotetrahydrofolate cyclodeaminase